MIVQRAGAAFRGGFGVCIRNRGYCVMAGSGLWHAHAGDSAERTYRMCAGGDAVALREKLVRLRGVREAVVVPEEGIARLTVYPGSSDERAATEIIGGES
ncbi:MAG TPA: hypothetical protein VEL09_15605 [Burkholderiales bacterium]|nr:hypothetical protein [Burkholderiales bacterium]